ncbi:unnamed protein product [Cylicostephanus goldi]|uniref:Uncharacterized protein n=1 Tax=Cylicostephanus goldi TaxID=71465 RepID=A0A3P7MNZ9_CYLGO|nr:unnamed protein product [Cylicostephanus goldi]
MCGVRLRRAVATHAMPVRGLGPPEGKYRRADHAVFLKAHINVFGDYMPTPLTRRRSSPDDSEYAPYAGTGPGFKKNKVR